MNTEHDLDLIYVARSSTIARYCNVIATLYYYYYYLEDIDVVFHFYLEQVLILSTRLVIFSLMGHTQELLRLNIMLLQNWSSDFRYEADVE